MARTILDCVGGTTMVPLRNIVLRSGARVFLKLEDQNPTGSMKDVLQLLTR